MASILPDTCSCIALEHSPDPTFGIPGDAPSRFLAVVWLRRRHRYSDGLPVCAPLVVGKSLRNLWTHCAYAAPCVRSSPQCSLRPCRVPTEVSSGLLRHLMNVYAASPHFYTVAPASQSSPVAHNCAVLPVFALLTRAAAHVGLMYYLGAAHCSLGSHLQEQCGPFPGAASTWAVSLRSHTIRVLITALPGQRFARPRQLLSWNTFDTPGQRYTMPHQRQQCTPHWL